MQSLSQVRIEGQDELPGCRALGSALAVRRIPKPGTHRGPFPGPGDPQLMATGERWAVRRRHESYYLCMSRAFVDEDASSSREVELPEIKIPIPPGSRNHLTPEGAEALSRELHELTGVERPRLMAGLAASGDETSASGGDEKAVARKRLAEVDRRIAYLYAMSSLAEVHTPPPPDARDRVKFGASVEVRDGEGETRSYRIVGVDEADPERGSIGWASPVARALIGKRVGDRATVNLPAGEEVLLIVAIGYPD